MREAGTGERTWEGARPDEFFFSVSENEVIRMPVCLSECLSGCLFLSGHLVRAAAPFSGFRRRVGFSPLALFS